MAHRLKNHRYVVKGVREIFCEMLDFFYPRMRLSLRPHQGITTDVLRSLLLGVAAAPAMIVGVKHHEEVSKEIY